MTETTQLIFDFQAKLATFFESIGWKVFRVPETATVLMSGGIAFGELNDEQVMDFQVKRSGVNPMNSLQACTYKLGNTSHL